jgi:hypothetical protein
MLLRRSRLTSELEKLALRLLPAAASVGQKGTALGKFTRRHGGKMLFGGLAVPATAIEAKDIARRAKAGLSEANFRARMAGRAPAGAPKRPRV